MKDCQKVFDHVRPAGILHAARLMQQGQWVYTGYHSNKLPQLWNYIIRTNRFSLQYTLVLAKC